MGLKYIKLFEEISGPDWYQDLYYSGSGAPYRMALNEEVLKQIAAKFGEEIIDYIGGGNNGWAFRLKSGKVLKITGDSDEYHSANRLSKLRMLQHVISYYDVRQIDIEGHDEHYAIIMDHVTILNDDEKSFWEDCQYRFLNDSYSDADIRKRFDDLYGIEGVSNFTISDYNINGRIFWENLMKQRDQILKDFKRASVTRVEAHSNNIGFDKFGQLRYFDVWSISERRYTSGRMNKSIDIPLQSEIKDK